MTFVALKTVIHANTEVVLSSLKSGNDGLFQREVIMGEGGSTVEKLQEIVLLWTYLLTKEKKQVKWLLKASIKRTDDDGGHVIKMNTILEEELPNDAQNKLAKIRVGKSWKGDVIDGFMKDCILTTGNAAHGTSMVCFKGDVDEGYALHEETDKSMKIGKMMSKLQTAAAAAGNFRAPRAYASALKAVRGIWASLTKQHENSERVDEERYAFTMNEIDQEEASQPWDQKERAIMEMGKMMLSTRKGWKYFSHDIGGTMRLAKFCNEGDSVPWCKAETLVHTSPKRLLAYLLNFDSIERMENHEKKFGKLPRSMKVSGKGGIRDARHFFYTVRLPMARRNRRFEVRATWEKETNANGDEVYRFAWSDSNDSNVRASHRFSDGSEYDSRSSLLASTRGIYELRGVVRNVTHVTHVRRDDLKGTLSLILTDSTFVRMTVATVRDIQADYERNQGKLDLGGFGSSLQRGGPFLFLEFFISLPSSVHTQTHKHTNTRIRAHHFPIGRCGRQGN